MGKKEKQPDIIAPSSLGNIFYFIVHAGDNNNIFGTKTYLVIHWLEEIIVSSAIYGLDKFKILPQLIRRTCSNLVSGNAETNI
jgi:hypothetical protein